MPVLYVTLTRDAYLTSIATPLCGQQMIESMKLQLEVCDTPCMGYYMYKVRVKIGRLSPLHSIGRDKTRESLRVGNDRDILMDVGIFLGALA